MRVVKILCFVPLVCFAVSLSAMQQPSSRATGVLLPAPAWPPDGQIPSGLRDRYVFIDLVHGEGVLRYPENLGTPTYAMNPGAIKTIRFELTRNVKPLVKFSVVAIGSSGYRYDYAVNNEIGAKHPIARWNIALPQYGNHQIVDSGSWRTIVRSRKSIEQKPAWVPDGATAAWYAIDDNQGVIAGNQAVEFHVESDYRPGFTVGYFRGGPNEDVTLPSGENLPQAVIDQLSGVVATEFNSQIRTLIGPKFSAVTNDYIVVLDFRQGIRQMILEKLLDPDSDFCKKTLEALDQYVTLATATETSLDYFHAAPPLLIAKPTTEVEKSILDALKISLRVK